MIINPIISNWFNGVDYSFKRLGYRNFNWLIGHLSGLAGTGISAVDHAYRELYGDAPVIEEASVTSKRQWKDLVKTYPFYRPVCELRDFIRDKFHSSEILGFFIHGSLSTMDYVENYSDCDTLVIIRKEVMDNPEWAEDFKRRLAQSNTFLYLLDPLQHHQHFVISEYDMRYYFQPVFPLVLFDYATELTDFNNELTFRCLDSSGCLTRFLDTWGDFFVRKMTEKEMMRTYDVKHAIQMILILPTLYSQAKTGEYRYKKFSFENVKNDFPTELWKVIENATMVRGSCGFHSRYPYRLRKMLGLKLHYRLLHLLHYYLDRNNKGEMLEIMGPQYLEEGHELLQSMKTMLKTRGMLS